MAYAVEAFVQILGKDHHVNLVYSKPQIECLLEKARCLRDCIEKSSSICMENLIRDAVYEAEDIVERHVRDEYLSAEGLTPLDLKVQMEKFDSIHKDMSRSPQEPDPSSPLLQEPIPSSNHKLVGFDEDVNRLLGLLTEDRQPELQVISVEGMGGSGKTALAKSLFNHSLVERYFEYRAWITLSQKFDLTAVLVALRDSLINLTDEKCREGANADDVGDVVFKLLSGRRYLIVVDDVWDTDTWDQLSFIFPHEEKKGSRILLTTRERSVARYVSFSNNNMVDEMHPHSQEHKNVHTMRLLNEDESLKLLQNVCRQEISTAENEMKAIGRKIANNCGGLPLAIIVVGGLLSAAERTTESWESIEIRFRSSEGNVRYSEILSKSYDNLPYHLKPCFLYVGAFPEGNPIQASKIIKLWIAEGIVKPILDNTLEDAAFVYLNELIDRNLLSVCMQDSNGKVRSFRIHHLLRELCQKKAVEEKFMWFKILDDLNVEEGAMRRVSVHPLSHVSVPPLRQLSDDESPVRSFLCFSPASQPSLPSPPSASYLKLLPTLVSYLKLLRVLDMFQLELIQFPEEIQHLIFLRYLSLKCQSRNLPSLPFKFHNLQTFIFQLPSLKHVSLQSLVRWMTQLMHIKFKKACIRYRPEDGEVAIQNNLETLSNVEACGISALVQSTPNLRKLGIIYNIPINNTAIDLACLERLEKLKCYSVLPAMPEFLTGLRFPASLRKLTLEFCKIPWGFMTHVGSLQYLEQLKLRSSEFLGSESDLEETDSKWESIAGGFQQLTSLTMKDLDLVDWIAESTHFPSLQHLTVFRCLLLTEIPSDFGCSATLDLIEVDDSSHVVLESAETIQKEQHGSGNPIKLVVHRSY